MRLVLAFRCCGVRYDNFDMILSHFLRISQLHATRHPRGVPCSTYRLCLWNADWCLRCDALANLGLQVTSEACG